MYATPSRTAISTSDDSIHATSMTNASILG